MQAERLLCPGAAPDFICCNFPNVMDVMEKNERERSHEMVSLPFFFCIWHNH